MSISSAENIQTKSEPVLDGAPMEGRPSQPAKTTAKKVEADLSGLGKMEMNIGVSVEDETRNSKAKTVPGADCHTGINPLAKLEDFEEELGDYLESLTAQSPGMKHMEDIVHVAANITEEPMFNIFIAAMIGLNALQMGVAHMIPKDPTDPSQLFGAWPALFEVFENIFTVVFLLEALVKLLYMRLNYFKTPWNIIDFVLVWVAMIDNWILKSLADGGSIGGFTALRVFRLVRVARVVKLLRSNKHIRVLLEGLASSLVGMVPIAVMLGLSIYAMALVSLELIGEDREKLESQETPLDVELYFGSFWRTCLTLFSMVILAEWGNIVWPIAERQPFFIVLVCLFVLICSFGLMNVIIGIICEKTNDASDNIKAEAAEQNQSLQMTMVKNMVHALIAVDTNNDGTIDYNELEQPACREIMEQLGLPKGFDGNELLQMLDFDGSGQVTKREFAISMFRLIHANAFQSKCLEALHFNSIKQLTRIAAAQQASSFNIVLEELASIKDMLHGHLTHFNEDSQTTETVAGSQVQQEAKATDQMPAIRQQKLMEMQAAGIRLDPPQFAESRVAEALAQAEIKGLLERLERELEGLGESVALLRSDLQHTAKGAQGIEFALEEGVASPPSDSCFQCADRPITKSVSPQERRAVLGEIATNLANTQPRTPTPSVDHSNR